MHQYRFGAQGIILKATYLCNTSRNIVSDLISCYQLLLLNLCY